MKKIKKNLFSLVGISILGIFIFLLYAYIKNIPQSEMKEIYAGEKISEYTPLYAQKLENIDSQYYGDSVFLSCVKEKINYCQNTFLSQQKILSGGLLQIMNEVSSLGGNELFDNCAGDALNQCYNQVVTENIKNSTDESVCNAYISDEVFYQNCMKDMYIKIAITKSDVIICDKNNDSLERNFCIDSFLSAKAIENRDISYCDKSTDQFSIKLCRDNFYFKVASDMTEISYCKKAGNLNAISNCALNFINDKIIKKDIDCQDINEIYKNYLRENDISDLLSRCNREIEGKNDILSLPLDMNTPLSGSGKILSPDNNSQIIDMSSTDED